MQAQTCLLHCLAAACTGSLRNHGPWCHRQLSGGPGWPCLLGTQLPPPSTTEQVHQGGGSLALRQARLQGGVGGSIFRTTSLPGRHHLREVVIEQLSPSTKRLRITEGEPESTSGTGHVLLALPARSPPDHAAAWPGESFVHAGSCASWQVSLCGSC